jgi:hypothetical protein
MSEKLTAPISELTDLGAFPSIIGTSYLGDNLSEGTVISDFGHSLRLEGKGPCVERPQSSYFLLSLSPQRPPTGPMYYRQDDNRHSP